MALETFYSTTHLPLAESLPGLRTIEVSRMKGKPGGESRFYLMIELYFDSDHAFWLALASEQGQQLMAALKPWDEAKLLTWFYAEAWSEDRV